MAKSAKEAAIEFETERSHQAAGIAYDLSKAAGQACLLINGGAATAVIAFLSKEHVDPAVYRIVPWCLAGYALRVFASALSLFCEMMNADYWNYRWYALSYEKDIAYAGHCETIADRWHLAYYCAFWAAAAIFIISSAMMAYALFQKTPAIPLPIPG